MYRYDAHDHALVQQRVDQFRDQTQRFLAGELPDEEFKALRLRNGLYIQRFAPMLRVSVPYGLLSSPQLRTLAHIARRYDKGYGHFSTRQNIQYNWPKLEDVPDILAELAKVEMHAIQTSGNCIRNITTDHLAGVAADEIVDPRPYCELTRQWATFHPEFNWLPRKFKIAFASSTGDRAATLVHDIGAHIVRNDKGELGYTVYVGGGLGRTPIIGQKLCDFLPEVDLLSYFEAILRVYNLWGRRDNIYKARIKILVKERGVEAFRNAVEAEWNAGLRGGDLTLTRDAIDRFKRHFDAHPYRRDAAADLADHERAQADDSAFAAFCKRNVLAHRVEGYKAVFISLKAPGVAPGDITAEQLEVVADLAERYSFGEARSTHDQNLVLAEVAQGDVHAVWKVLKAHHLAPPNIGLLTDMICCPGLDFCSLANASSISVADDIYARFDTLDDQYDIGELKLKMSGCMNGCGHHSVGHIGILGVDKKGEEWYIIQTYLDQREGEDETFLECYRRVGMKPFKQRIYA